MFMFKCPKSSYERGIKKKKELITETNLATWCHIRSYLPFSLFKRRTYGAGGLNIQEVSWVGVYIKRQDDFTDGSRQPPYRKGRGRRRRCRRRRRRGMGKGRGRGSRVRRRRRRGEEKRRREKKGKVGRKEKGGNAKGGRSFPAVNRSGNYIVFLILTILLLKSAYPFFGKVKRLISHEMKVNLYNTQGRRDIGVAGAMGEFSEWRYEL